MSRVAVSPFSRYGVRGNSTKARSKAVTSAIPMLYSFREGETGEEDSSLSVSGVCAVLGKSFTWVLFLLFIQRLILFVCLDDLLDQLVAYDIPVGEIYKSNALDAVKDFLHLNEARTPAAWKVNLGNIAGHHGPRVKSQPGEKHLHLFRGCILGLIQNDERVVQRAAAHEGKRSNLDITAFDEFVGFFHFDHVIERVVERSQVRVHL